MNYSTRISGRISNFLTFSIKFRPSEYGTKDLSYRIKFGNYLFELDGTKI